MRGRHEDDYNDISTESERSCPKDYKILMGSYKEEDDSRYFKNAFDSYGTRWSEC